MTEQDKRIAEIRNVIHACVAEGGPWLLDGSDAVALLARLDALTAERDVLRVERDEWTAERAAVIAEVEASTQRWRSLSELRRKTEDERDALAARLATAEAALRRLVVAYDQYEGDDWWDALAGAVTDARAALAGSREQAQGA